MLLRQFTRIQSLSLWPWSVSPFYLTGNSCLHLQVPLILLNYSSVTPPVVVVQGQSSQCTNSRFFFFLKIRVPDEHLMLIHMMRIAKLKKKSFFSSCCRCSTESRRAILMKHGWSQDFCLPFWLTSSHHKTSWIKSSESSYPASNHIHTWLPRSSSRYYLVPLKWLEKAVSPNCKIASYKGEHERDC